MDFSHSKLILNFKFQGFHYLVYSSPPLLNLLHIPLSMYVFLSKILENTYREGGIEQVENPALYTRLGC